jgi:hypothetical protein
VERIALLQSRDLESPPVRPVTHALDDAQERSPSVLLLEGWESGASADRAPVGVLRLFRGKSWWDACRHAHFVELWRECRASAKP